MSDPRLDALAVADTALLIIDMQNAFVSPEGTLGSSGVDMSDGVTATANVAALIHAATECGMPVLWTQQQHLADDAGRLSKRLAPHTSRRVGVAALAGTWDAEIIAELPAPRDAVDVVVKHRFGAFHDTRLETLLRMRGARTVIVTGSTANACVDTTVREAYLRDLDVVVPLDAVVGINPEWKRVAGEIWNHYFGAVTDTASVLGWLRERRGER